VWVSNLLDQVLGEVKEYYCRKGKATHWKVFREAVWAPIQTGRRAPSLAKLCKKYGISDEAGNRHAKRTHLGAASGPTWARL
jgi:hypothetical protein